MFSLGRGLKTGSFMFTLSVLIVYGYLWTTKVNDEDNSKIKYFLDSQQQQQHQQQQQQQQQQQKNVVEAVANLPTVNLSQPPGFNFTNSLLKANTFYR